MTKIVVKRKKNPEKNRKKTLITKRVIVGHAWPKQGRKVKFYSGYLSSDGLELMYHLSQKKQGKVNIIMLPNFMKGRSKDYPPHVFYALYSAEV
jgi:uncharacterized protein YozE (UPF0346 family)